jgi:galactose-1-phosphate uridylyltransferase
MWGKRGWDNFHGSWGKRWPEEEIAMSEETAADPDELSDEQVAQLAELMLLTHAEAPNPPPGPATTAAVLSQLSDEEQKRSWNNLRGAWGKRGWSNFKGT